MLIVVAVAMLRASMLMLVAVLMVIATLHPRDQDKPPSPAAPTQRASERKEQQEKGEEVSMCMHLYAFVCLPQYTHMHNNCTHIYVGLW